MTKQELLRYSAIVDEAEQRLADAISRCISAWMLERGVDQDAAVEVFGAAICNIANGGKK